MRKIRLAILASGRGSLFSKLLNSIEEKRLKLTMEIVISNNENAFALKQAKLLNLNAMAISSKNLDRLTHEKLLTQALTKHRIDLVLLLGYMRILSSEFVKAWQNKIINVHPSLLPDFAGLMDLHVHKAVLSSGKKETGCSVHYVNEVVDGGEVIIQKKCSVYETDTPELLKKRVQELEIDALIETIQKIQNEPAIIDKKQEVIK